MPWFLPACPLLHQQPLGVKAQLTTLCNSLLIVKVCGVRPCPASRSSGSTPATASGPGLSGTDRSSAPTGAFTATGWQ